MMTRSTPRATPDGFEPGATITRLLAVEPQSYDSRTRTVDAVVTTGAPVRRFGVIEEMSLDPASVDLGRAADGRMAFLFNHDHDRPIGVVEGVRFEGGVPVARLRFSETEDGRAFEGQVARRELSQISIGYRVTSWTLRAVENDVEIWRADKWELYEVSLVTVPADPAAVIRSAPEPAAPAASNQESDDMRRNAAPAPGAPAVETPEIETRAAAATPAPTTDHSEALRAERARSAEIQEIAARHALPADLSASAIRDGVSVDEFRRRALDTLAGSQRPASTVRIERDETETRRLALEGAMLGQMTRQDPGQWSEPARAYASIGTLVGLAAERLGERRVPDSVAGREDILRRAFHSTTDFPIIFEGALNTTVAHRYALAQPVYRRISRRGDFMDFRPHTEVRVGDFPSLKPISENGEIKFGTFGESKEVVAINSYAIGVPISRQMMVNDRLGAIGDLLASYGATIALNEDQFAKAVLDLNSGAGPTLIEGNAAMFTTGRSNKASSGAAISDTTLSAGRAAMRKQKTVDGNPADGNKPVILLVSPDNQTIAEKQVNAVMATAAGDVNIWANRLEPVVWDLMSGAPWYLFADPAIRANFRWGLLDGYRAPRVRLENPFGQTGSAMTVEHDFGFGGVDFRAGYLNTGP